MKEITYLKIEHEMRIASEAASGITEELIREFEETVAGILGYDKVTVLASHFLGDNEEILHSYSLDRKEHRK